MNKKYKFMLVFIVLCLLLVVFLGKKYYDEKILEQSEVFKQLNIEDLQSHAEKGEINEAKINDLINGIKNNNSEKETDDIVSEADFLVLLLTVYGKEPVVTDTSKFWAEGYYKSAQNYNYQLYDGTKRDNSLTLLHTAEIISQIQGELLKGNKAWDYVSKNLPNIYNNYFLNSNKDDLVSFGTAINLAKDINESGFYMLQEMVNLEKNNKKTLVAIGDSITMGWGLNIKNSYPYLIGESEDLNVYNVAGKGLSSASFLQKLSKKPIYLEKINKADLITLNLGSADLLGVATEYLKKVKESDGANPSINEMKKIKDASYSVKGNIEKIITEIREVTSAPIYLYGLYNPIPEGMAGNDFGDSIIEDINKSIISYSETVNDVHYIDSFKVFNGNEKKYVTNGDIHPTVEGQKQLSALAIKAIDNKAD